MTGYLPLVGALLANESDTIGVSNDQQDTTMPVFHQHHRLDFLKPCPALPQKRLSLHAL